MEKEEPADLVLRFMERINHADVDGLCALMTDDHLFVDALGNRFQGVGNLRIGWKAYLSMFPDYRVSHEDIFQNGDVVAVIGSASGTYAVQGKLPKENHWEIPAAWKAVVRDGRIAEWRVYCDNQPARHLMGEKVP